MARAAPRRAAPRARADRVALPASRPPHERVRAHRARRHLRARGLPQRDRLALRPRRARAGQRVRAQARRAAVLRARARPTRSTACAARITPAMDAKYAHATSTAATRTRTAAATTSRAASRSTRSGTSRASRRPRRERSGYPTQKPLALLERVLARDDGRRRARRRPLRRQRHDGRGRTAPGPPFRRRRPLAAGDRGHLRAARSARRARIRRPTSSFRALDSLPRQSPQSSRRETSARWRTSVRTDESGHPAGECMYQYSRAIFLAVKDLVDDSQPGVEPGRGPTARLGRL